MANVLAGHLLAEVQLMQMHDDLELAGRLQSFAFPRKAVTEDDLKLAERVLAVPPGTYESCGSEGFSWVVGQPVPGDRLHLYARASQRLAEMPEQLSAPVQVLRLGPAAVVALPGEIFVETGLSIKSRSWASPLFLTSLSNAYIGYVCTDEALTDQGGYETWAATSSLGGVGTAPAMEGLAVSLLEDLR